MGTCLLFFAGCASHAQCGLANTRDPVLCSLDPTKEDTTKLQLLDQGPA